jgi:hypothetical protein
LAGNVETSDVILAVSLVVVVALVALKSTAGGCSIVGGGVTVLAVSLVVVVALVALKSTAGGCSIVGGGVTVLAVSLVVVVALVELPVRVGISLLVAPVSEEAI